MSAGAPFVLDAGTSRLAARLQRIGVGHVHGVLPWLFPTINLGSDNFDEERAVFLSEARVAAAAGQSPIFQLGAVRGDLEVLALWTSAGSTHEVSLLFAPIAAALPAVVAATQSDPNGVSNGDFSATQTATVALPGALMGQANTTNWLPLAGTRIRIGRQLVVQEVVAASSLRCGAMWRNC